MVYSTFLAERLRKLLNHRQGITEKAMFGGISFLLQGKMFCGVLKDDLVVRVDPKESNKLLKKPNVRPMDFTGKPMKGFLYVSQKGYDTDEKLKGWIHRCFTYVSSLLQKTK